MRTGKVFGIASKVLVGLSLITLMVVFSSVVLLVTFTYFSSGFTDISQHQIPSLIHAFQLVRESERLVANAPDIIIAQEQFIRETLALDIAKKAKQKDELILSLQEVGVTPQKLAELSAQFDLLFTNLRTLVDITNDRIKTDSRIARLILRLRRLSEQLHVIFSSESTPSLSTRMWFHRIEQAIVNMIALQSIDDEAYLSRLKKESLSLLDEAKRLLPESSPDVQLILSPFQQELTTHGTGNGNIFVLRRRQLSLRNQIEEALHQSRFLSGELVTVANTIFSETHDNIVHQNDYFNQGLHRLSSMLIAIPVICIFSAIAIYLYIRQSVIGRLLKLKSSMLAHVNGEVVPIPSNGTDEIAEMSRAVEHFVTVKDQAEEALRESEERYRRLVELSPDAIVVRQNSIYVYANQAAVDLFGAPSREALIGQSIFDMIHPSYYEIVKKRIDDIYRGTEIAPLLEEKYRRFDGREIDVEVTASLISFYGEPAGLVVIRDITGRKQAEERLQRYAAELKEANTELFQYAYIVSHDLKAPLRAIYNYAAFLREDLEALLNEEQIVYFDGLERAVREADSLIGDILEFSRVGRQHVEVEMVDSGTFLRSLISSLKLPEDVEIIIEDDWPMLFTEPVLLKQVFQNLLENAVKFNTSSPKRVELGWQPIGEEYYELFVRDNGIGIAQDHSEKIFRVFERLHTKEEFDGTGIGLAIVKKALSKLGGSIRVESTTGEGSTFFVLFPRNLKSEQ